MINKEFVKNTITLSGGTAIASLIPFLLQPLLRRIYSPEDYGAFTVYLSLAGILVVISTFRYELAIVLSRSDREATAITYLSMLVSFLVNLTAFALVILLPGAFMRFLNFPISYGPWLYLVPLSALLFSGFYIFNYWFIRKKAFGLSASCKIARRSIEGGIQILSKNISGSSAGLVAGDLAGHALNLTLGGVFSAKKGFRFMKISLPEIREKAFKHRNLAIYNTLPTLLNTITIAMPVFLVVNFYSVYQTGQLDLARLILFVPLVLISEPLAQVFYQFATEKKQGGLTIIKQAGRLAGVLIISAITGIVIMQFWAEELIYFLFGKEWSESAGYACILVYSIGLRFVVEPFKFIFAAFEKIQILSAWQVMYFLSVGILIFASGMEIHTFLRTFVYIELGCYLLLLGIIFHQLYLYERRRDPEPA